MSFEYDRVRAIVWHEQALELLDQRLLPGTLRYQRSVSYTHLDVYKRQHECFHVIDLPSGQKTIHISEFDEPAFSNQNPQQKIHNPSAYASFAGQISEKTVAWPPQKRFGAGNPSQ